MTETDTAHFKNQTLPLARIKKIMKSDEDVRMISAEAPVLFAKACEFFVLELTQRAWQAAEESKRRTLQRCDIAQAIQRIDVFDFLLDIVPYEEPPPDSGASPAAGPGSLPPAAAQGPTSHAGAVPPDPQYQGQQQARMGHYGTGLRYAPQQGMAYGQPPPQYHPGMYPPPQQYPYPSYPPVMGQGAPYSSVPGSYPPSPSLGGRPSGMGQ